jgi:hypothetical protein
MEVTINGMQFGLQAEYIEGYDSDWRAWCFFAYDKDVNIYPADEVPPGILTHESIAGENGSSEAEALQRLEAKLREVIASRSLEGTGFYSPPADKIYPQEFPGRSPSDLRGS